jgi:F-type H+-transporting ATPase subunit a
MAEEHAHDPLESGHLIGHVKDSTYFEVPHKVAEGGKIKIPQPFDMDEAITVHTGFKPVDDLFEPIDGKLTKFMVLEIVAALLITLIFCWLAGKVKDGSAPRGKLWNLLETFLVFIRDQVARPAIGHHDGDKFLPFLWTVFFFVLACNLLGMIPFMGSPTGAMAVTLALALITFVTVVGAGMVKLGPVHFWAAQVPPMDIKGPGGFVLKIAIFFIEVMGLLIKHFILAVRLLANMMAGHLVLAVVLAFVLASAHSYAFLAVAPASVVGATLLSLLELFVAFLQAYIFTFLTALFIGMAVHPH